MTSSLRKPSGRRGTGGRRYPDLILAAAAVVACSLSFLAGTMAGISASACPESGARDTSILSPRDVASASASASVASIGDASDGDGDGSGGRGRSDLPKSSEIDDRIDAEVRRRVEEEIGSIRRECEEYANDANIDNNDGVPDSNDAPTLKGRKKKKRRFGASTGKFATGASRTSKEDFLRLYDYGVPSDGRDKTPGERDVLIFYSGENSVPDGMIESSMYENGEGVPFLAADRVAENCDTMNVVTTGNPGKARQCLAVMNGYESYHVQRWMRVEGETRKGGTNPKEPLAHVSRGHSPWGKRDFIPPSKWVVRAHWQQLQEYLGGIELVLERLKPIAERTAVDNKIVVLTCNMGQSELLMNFACNARAKGFDTGNVLVFPTDKETHDLARGLGLESYYDEKVRSRGLRSAQLSNSRVCVFPPARSTLDH